MTEGASTDKSEGVRGGDGRKSTAVGEGEGVFTAGSGGENDGDLTEGVTADDGDLYGVATTGVLFRGKVVEVIVVRSSDKAKIKEESMDPNLQISPPKS